MTDCVDLISNVERKRVNKKQALDKYAQAIFVCRQVETESFIFLRNFASLGRAIAFEIEIGLPDHLSGDLTTRKVDIGQRLEGLLHLAQLRGRTLPVSAARFADQLARRLTT